MKYTVKDLLKMDLPPTTADAKMRREHTVGSLTHQIKHFGDHGMAAVDQLEKLKTVDSKKAKGEVNRVLKEVNRVKKALEDFKRSCK